jgi:hypothetical protein
MKLSEAILLGSTLRPQIKGYLFADGRSCALGAAGEAIGAQPKDCQGSWEFIRNAWPWTQALSFGCPACWRPKGTWKVLDLIVHLNDFHSWTRQCTAAWVASVEPGEKEGRVEASVDNVSAMQQLEHDKKV